MGKVKLSSDEQKTLRKKTKAELNRIEKILTNNENLQLLNDFKNKFNLCETVYKIVLKEYKKKNSGTTIKKSKKKFEITMKQVPAALEFAGYAIDKSLLNEIFGSPGKKKKTVKELRNDVTHGVSDKALKEIEERKEELFGYMDSFLNLIKTSD